MNVRIWVVISLLLVIVSACGGDQATLATDVPPATDRPDPTATPLAQLPTQESTGEVGLNQDGIPLYPQSMPYVSGKSVLIDALIDGMQGSFENNPNTDLNVEGFDFYTSKDPLSDILDFYTAEMPTHGWKVSDTSNDNGQYISFYTSSDSSVAAVVGVIDLTSIAPSIKDVLIFFEANDVSASLDPNPVAPAGMSIPLPAESEPYVEGDDPVIDGAVTAMRAKFDDQQDMDLTPIEFFMIDQDIESMTDFFNAEMADYGWDVANVSVEDQPTSRVIVYPAADTAEVVALVGLLDLAAIDSSMSGILGFTTIGSLAGSGSLPGGSSTRSSIGDFPLPADAVEVQKGEDPILDTFIESFGKSFQESQNADSQVLYSSSLDLAALIDFYRTEMIQDGWTEQTMQDSGTTAVLLFQKDSLQNAMVIVMDGSMLLKDDNYVILIDMGQN